MLCFQLFMLQTGQRTQTHIDNCLCLYVGQTKALDQTILGDLRGLAAADNLDDLIDMILCNQQAL